MLHSFFRAQRKAKGDHGPIQGQDQDPGQGQGRDLDQGQGGEVGAELLPAQRNENQGKLKFIIFFSVKVGPGLTFYMLNERTCIRIISDYTFFRYSPC